MTLGRQMALQNLFNICSRNGCCIHMKAISHEMLKMHILDLIFNTLRPTQNGRRFADDTFKRNFLNGNVRTSIEISLKYVPKGPINNIPALVQIIKSGD